MTITQYGPYQVTLVAFATPGVICMTDNGVICFGTLFEYIRINFMFTKGILKFHFKTQKLLHLQLKPEGQHNPSSKLKWKVSQAQLRCIFTETHGSFAFCFLLYFCFRAKYLFFDDIWFRR